MHNDELSNSMYLKRLNKEVNLNEKIFLKFHLKSENEPLDINLDCQSCRLWQVWVNRPFIATGLRRILFTN